MKIWISQSDGRVRDSHVQLNGVIVARKAKFPNGLMYPGDRSGAPAEVYNCRCSLGSVLPEMLEDYTGDGIFATGHTVESYNKWLEEKRTEQQEIWNSKSGGGWGGFTNTSSNDDGFTSGNSNGNINTFYVHTGKHRNEDPLDEKQIEECVAYARKLGSPSDIINYSNYTSTSYFGTYDEDGYLSEVLIIGTDVMPSKNGKTANERLPWKSAVAHEIVGHRDAFLSGHRQKIDIYEEIQASIRAARFAPDLSDSERYMLLRDANERAVNHGLSLRKIRNSLYITER